MRVEWEDDDLRLHEARRSAESEGDRRRARHDGSESLEELLARRIGGDRAHPRRAGERDVRRLAECGEARVVATLQLDDAGPGGAADGREDEDAALRAAHAPERRTMRGLSGGCGWR